ncbi:rCG52796 [Rattus norvegicus]|uniref:RCG52796 n=1 Tax=Rattus norvegicus TaxID=10116 RepID=A6IQX0_RAT|nr:rCG52796 [Rattus norvegicus]
MLTRGSRRKGSSRDIKQLPDHNMSPLKGTGTRCPSPCLSRRHTSPMQS